MANENNAPATIDLKEKAMEAAEKKEAVTPDLIRNVSVNIGGRDIPLQYTMRVQLQIEEELGMDFSEINDRLKGKKNTRVVIGLIRLMGNAGLKNAGQAADLTDDWLIDHIKPGFTTTYRIAAMAAVTAGWFMENEQDKSDEQKDDILEEIRKKKREYRLSYRKVASYGLIAGLSWEDMQDMLPGEVVDCFLYRREYDDAHFGVRRE